MANTLRVITAVSLCVFIVACGGGGDNTPASASTETGSSQNQNLQSNGNGASSTGTPADGTNSNTGATGNSLGAGATSPANTSGGNTGPATQTPPDAGGVTPGNSDPTFAYDTTARFNMPSDMVSDVAGNLYVLDFGNKVIRKISTTGDVTTLPATYSSPRSSLAMDGGGNLYIIDGENIYRVSPAGDRTLVMTYPAIQGGGSVQALAIAADAEGSIYVLTRYRNLFWVHKIDPNNPPQGVFLGNGTGPHLVAYSINTYGEITGIASDAHGNLALTVLGPQPDHTSIIYVPRAAQPAQGTSGLVKDWNFAFGVPKMAFDAAGNLWYSNSTYFTSDGKYHFRLLRVTPEDGQLGEYFDIYPNGDPTRTSLSPNGFGLAFGSDGVKYVADPDVNAVFRIPASGKPGLYAGKPGEAGSSD